MFKYIFGGLLVLTAIEFAYIAGMYNPMENKAQAAVMDICNYSRTVQSGEWEEACGMAQDSSNTEFLCSDTTITATCWVEVKEK